MSSQEISQLMKEIGIKAKAASSQLAKLSSADKTAALKAMAANIRTNALDLMHANEKDLVKADELELSSALRDRLVLNPDRIEAIAVSLETVADFKDPIGDVTESWERPNGLKISRMRVPLGVIGVIYESRPNVTADAGALCLKAGNAAILRGGSESVHSARAIYKCLVEGLVSAGLPEDAIQLVPTQDRDAVGCMLKEMGAYIDILIPRGGKGLNTRVMAEARVPVIGHLEGICHVYIDKDASIEKAAAITLNAKMRRPGICGSAETLLIDRAVKNTHVGPVLEALLEAGCEIRGDKEICALEPRATPADEEDWGTEYLEAILSVKLVNGVDEAVAHIEKWGSGHTEAIITENEDTATRFTRVLDSAIIMVNASTQYADGGEFGMGAEIGIATGKMHARGPVGAEQLTSYKYIVHGSGQVRP
jgi:glutamate-5-semialdehyde dehydrogenase